MNPRLERNPAKTADRTDRIGSVDVASDGVTTASQERVRDEARAWLAQERSCVSDDVYAALEKRVAEMLASQEAERLDLDLEFAAIRTEIIARSSMGAGEIAREQARDASMASMGLRGLPDRYAPAEEYFDLDTQTVAVIRDIERDLGLAIMPALARCQQSVERALALPADSSMAPSELAALRASVRAMVRARTAELPAVVRVRQEASPTGQLDREDRWIINTELKNEFSIIERSVLASARFTVLMSSPSYRGALESSPEYVADIGLRSHVMGRTMDARDAFFGDRDPSDDIPGGLIRHDSFIKQVTMRESLEAHDRFLEGFAPDGRPDLRLGGGRATEFLSERDSKVERQAMIYFLLAVGFQMTPYLGGAASIMVDVEDTVSSQDATMNWLKRAGLVPQEYRTDKMWLDNVMGLVGIGLTVVGLQAMAKTGKLAKALRTIGKFKPGEFEEMMQKLAKATERQQETSDIATAIGTTAKSATEDAEEAAGAQRTADSSVRESEARPKAETKVDHETIWKNANLGEKERVEEADHLLATETGRRTPLSTVQRQGMFAVHDVLSQGIFANEISDLRTIREFLTGTLPEAKKASVRDRLERGGYNPALVDTVAREPLKPEEVGVLVRYGILGKPVSAQQEKIITQLVDMARGADGHASLVRFARAANDNKKPTSEIRLLIEEVCRRSGMDAETASDMAVYVTARGHMGDRASPAEVAAAVFVSLDRSGAVSTTHINRVLIRLVEDGTIAAADRPRIGTGVVGQLRQSGVPLELPRGYRAVAEAPAAPSPEDIGRLVRDPGAVGSEAVRAVRNALTDTRIPASKAVDTLVEATGTAPLDRAAYDRLAAAIGGSEHYATGRRNSLIDALGARCLRSGLEAAGTDAAARMRAVEAAFGPTPDAARLRGALDELRNQRVIDHAATQDILGRLQRAEDVLRNRRALEPLQEFKDGVARYGVAGIDECFDPTKPLSIDGQAISADTVLGLLDGSLAAPDPLRTKRIVAELEARTPLGRMRAMLRESGLAVTRDLLGGGNLRTDTRIYAIADINAALKGDGGLTPKEFEALEAALRTRVDEVRMRRSHELMARPEAETAAVAAIDRARSVRETIETRFNMRGIGAGQRILFVPETTEDMREMQQFFEQMRTDLYSAAARGDDGRIRRTPDGKPLLEFDRVQFRSGRENDMMRQWSEAWVQNFDGVMRYLEMAVSKYTDSVRKNALMDLHGAEGGRIDLDEVLSATERANLLKLTDSFAHVVSDFLDMARANNLMVPEEVTTMTRDMYRDLWTVRKQLNSPEKFRSIREKAEDVQRVYNGNFEKFKKPFGEEERQAVYDLAIEIEKKSEGRTTLGDMSTNAIVNKLFLEPLAAARRAAA